MFDIQTKVLKRDVFEYLLDLEIKRAMRYQYFFSLLIIEPDLQVDVHNEADIIKAIAEIISDEVRATDTIGRMGKNNFYVMLPHSETSCTITVAERIRNRVESYTFSKSNGVTKKTISIGAACFPTHSNELKNLVNNATEMMNKAKETGGNRVCLPY
ncbi:MAG: GGDEF domain-containing protein [Nitrospirae bacterium]|nr:GGDEF domain-containing protein [Nitrospirota bacterium]